MRLWSSGSRAICWTVCDEFVSRALEVVLVALCPKFMCAPRSRHLLTTLIVLSLYFHLCAFSLVCACLLDAKIKLFCVATRAPMSCRKVCVVSVAVMIVFMWSGHDAVTSKSSGSVRGSAPTLSISRIHGLSNKATIVILSGHPWGMPFARLCASPKPAASVL